MIPKATFAAHIFLSVATCAIMFSICSTAYANVIIQPTPSTGLLAYWTFDSKTINWTSNIVADTSSNGNTGTLVNMTSATNQVAGKKGQALFFDGILDSVSLASNPLNVVANSSSACVWANTNDITAAAGAWDQTFLNLYTDANNGIRMGNVTNSGRFFASYRVGGAYYGGETTSGIFINDTWVHVCYVWNGTGITLYANGSSVATTTNSNSIGLVNTIGARNDEGDGAWSGSIDDLRIYNRALSLTEIKQIYQSGALVLNSLPNKTVVLQKTPSNFLTNGLVGYWSFDGSKINWATNRATDSSGNGNTGTIINMSTTSSPAQGKMGQALSFDGVDDYVSTASTVDFGGTKVITLSFWAKIDLYNNDGASTIELSTIYNNNDGAFRIALDGILGTPLAGIQDGTSGSPSFRSESFPTRPSAGVWHHYVIILDNSTVTGDVIGYLDGILQSLTLGVNTKNQSSAFKTDTLYFMSRAGTSLFENGSLDDLRIYNRALSDTEVRQLYLQGK